MPPLALRDGKTLGVTVDPDVLALDRGQGKTTIALAELVTAVRSCPLRQSVGVFVCAYPSRGRVMLERLASDYGWRPKYSLFEAHELTDTAVNRIHIVSEQQVIGGRLRGLDRMTIVVVDDADATEHGVCQGPLATHLWCFDFRLATYTPFVGAKSLGGTSCHP